MGFNTLILRQYREIVDAVPSVIGRLDVPPEGWLRVVRKALGMSGAQLARRIGISRARVAQAEAAELSGAATLKSMKSMAEAMGCRFVYAVVPREGIRAAVDAQAHRKASSLVAAAGRHMALEAQELSPQAYADEVERVARELALTMPADFWEEDFHD
jgi:predicted DNA-binding mobile mystery protein A